MRQFKDKVRGRKARAPQGTAAGSEGTLGQSTERLSASNLVVPEDPEDADGLGLKVWSEHTAVDGPLVDIVFVHGLTGKRTKTWLADGAAQPWPQELLAKKIPEARILTYGYDADVAHFIKPAGQNTVREHARNLMGDLTNHRRKDSSQRPLIFVAHSLGGLICEQAIVLSSHQFEEEHLLFDSIYGIMFLGTPHAGSDLAKFALALARIIKISSVKSPNMSNLSALKKDSEILAGIQEAFSTAITGRERVEKKPVEIHCCIEELPVKWLRHRVVEPNSARFPGHHTSDTIPADHTSMTKFQRSSQVGYERLSGKLRKWVDDIPKAPGFSSQNKASQVQMYGREKLTFCFESSTELVQNIDLPTSELVDWQFQNRDAELNRLTELDIQFGRDKNMLIVLLHGSPGMGKTELALKFLKSLQPRYRYQFAIDAESEEAVQESFRRIAERLRITTSGEASDLASAQVRESAQAVSTNVRHKLTNTDVPWVLMFDNYSAAFPLKEYFPSKTQGRILVCAADQPESRSRIGAEEQCTVQVGPMEVQCLTNYFWSAVTGRPDYTPSERQAKKVNVLIQRLECHTLSIKLAASFFAEDRGGRATVEGLNDYIRAIDQQPNEYSKDINDNLWKAWQMLIGKLKEGTGETVDDALEYLHLRAFFSHHHLPTSLLFTNVAQQRHDSAWVEHEYIPAFIDHQSGSMRRCEQAERLLSRYGLVTIENVQDVRGTRMLKVLRLCTRQLLWDQAREQHLHFWCSALCTLGESIKWTFEHEDVAFRKLLVPHIDACLHVDGETYDRALSAINNRTAGHILLNFAAAYTDVGQFRRAGELQNKALERLMTDPGPEDDLTLKAKSEIASNLELNDKFEDAFRLREEVLKQRETCYLLNENDRTAERKYDTAAAFAAISYARLPAYKQKALTLREMRLEHIKKALKNSLLSQDERPGRLTLPKAKRELATSYFELDRKPEALRLREEVVDALAQENDVFTLNARRELLVSLSSARLFDRALCLGSNIVEDSKLLLGPDHPDTWLALSALATVKSRSGMSEDAKSELKAAVQKFSGFWGVNHSITIDARVELARAKLALNEAEEEREAMDIFREISQLFETLEGPRSYKKLRCDLEMAMVVQRRGSIVALENMKVIVSKLESILPNGDPSLIFAKLKLGGCFAQFEEFEEAASEYQWILCVFEGDRPQTSGSLKAKLRLATTYLNLAADRRREERSDFETLHTRLQERMKPSGTVSIKAAIRSGVKKLRPKVSVETIRPQPDHALVYQGLDRAQLEQKALELRAEVVAATTVFEGTEYKIQDQLAAQACFELSESCVQNHKPKEAIDLQRAVVSFYVQNFGLCSPVTQQHQGILRSWEMLGGK